MNTVNESVKSDSKGAGKTKLKQGRNYEWEMRWLYEALERRVKRGYSHGNEADAAAKVLDECLTLPHGPREERFILGVLDNIRRTRQLRKAA